MLKRNTRSVLTVLLLAFAVLIVMPVASPGQTFRGGINGTVTDQSGAVVPGAQVEAVDAATGVSHKTVSSSAGEFSFQDLPLGSYIVSVSASGFKAEKVSNVPVKAGVIYTLPLKLSIASMGETVEVSADAITLDTTTTTETTVVPSETVQDTPMNGRDFTQLIAIAPGFGGYSAGGFGSVNGSRANQVNWQIDGVDNNDLWHNVPSVNQGGVEGIAGVTLPLDSIDEYSQQSIAGAESGRNPGGTVNVATKSGTNQLHGSAYYYNRNEFLAKNSPFATPDANGDIVKNKLRNQQYGASIGGPIKKDRAFLFINYEKQQFIIESPASATEPSAAWEALADAEIAKYAMSPSASSVNVLHTLWPSYAVTGPAAANNYSNASPITGYSYNGFGRFDYTINQRNNLSLHYFGGQGNQIAPVGSQLPYYFEEGPIHIYNYSAVLNSTLSTRFTNQVLFGVNYFNQVFYDQNHSFDMNALGWNTGVSTAELGAPKITIAGFDGPAASTPPSGRNDITGHVTDAANFVLGKHEFRFGGEFRRGMVNEFYHRKFRGTFTFDGSQGPWSSDNSVPSQVLSLADFLVGYTQSDGIVRGDPEREVYVNSYNLFFEDSFQATPGLNLNFGVRYDYLGPMHDPFKDLSVFRPGLGGTGFAFQGNQIGSLYDASHLDFSPRVGVSYKVKPETVLHLGAGLYFDQPNLNPFLDNRPPNGGASGAESNPFGGSPVGSVNLNGQKIVAGQALFPSAATFSSSNSYNLFTVSPNFKSSYSSNFSLNIEQQLRQNVIFTVGYVGSLARKLLSIYDINQLPVGADALPTLGANGANAQRALYSKYSATIANMDNYGVINEIGSVGNSNYNSLQTTLKIANWKGMTSQFAYTWSHGLDEMTQYRNANPQNSQNFRGEYASMDYDTRNAFTAYINYDVPKFAGPHWLTGGWQLNSLLTFHGGQPYSILTGTDSSGTNEGEDRPNQTGPIVKGDRKLVKGSGFEQYFTSANLVVPTDAFGAVGRNTLVAPGYGDVDFSVFKNGHIGERVTAQFRMEFFNLFNHVNLAPPDQNLADAGYGTVTTTIGNYNGAPGLGPGEPFNTQVALKIIF